jgi:hypothetical protein
MKKLLPLLCIFFSLSASAQFSLPVKTAFSAGFELGVPQNSIYSIGLGLSGKAEFPVAGNVSLSVTAGYNTFFYKSNLFRSSLTPANACFVPLKAGAKYYFNGGVYVEGELGTAIETNYSKQRLFAFALGPGFIIPINDKHSLDAGFRYESWSDHQLRQTAIRIAYRFGL